MEEYMVRDMEEDMARGMEEDTEEDMERDTEEDMERDTEEGMEEGTSGVVRRSQVVRVVEADLGVTGQLNLSEFFLEPDHCRTVGSLDHSSSVRCGFLLFLETSRLALFLS